MNNLEKAIIATLKYHDKFDYPLTKQEIFIFLVLNEKLPPAGQAVPLDLFSRVPRLILRRASKTQKLLENLIKEKKIIKTDNYYCLPGREKIVEIRIKREIYSKEKLEIAKRIVQLFKFIPWIKMAGITGALAMNNAKKDDDIDLMVITKSNRLWLTRLWLIIILDILGKRRKPNDKQVKDKLCLNLFLDEESLKLKKAKQNLFTAHEIVQMKPILNRDNIYEKFLEANLWVRDYLPNALEIKKFMEIHGNSWEKKQTNNYLISNNFNKFLCFFEKIVYQLQYKFMKSKITNEEISIHYAFFHPKNIFKNL